MKKQQILVKHQNSQLIIVHHNNNSHNHNKILPKNLTNTILKNIICSANEMYL